MIPDKERHLYMAINKISEFPKVTPSAEDKILIEKNGEGGSATLASLPISTAVETRLTNLTLNAGDSSAECADARVNADESITYPSLKARLDAEHSELKGDLDDKILSTPNDANIYNSSNDTIYDNTVNKASVILDGYVGDLVVSTYGNYAQYFTSLSVKNAAGDDMGVSFGTDRIWNESITRRGVVVNIPSGAKTMEFHYQHHTSSGDVVISQVMVSKGNIVPNSYVEYIETNRLKNSPYVEKGNINPIVYVSPTGDDTKDGLTVGSAVATFAKALTIGKNIRAKRGEYNEKLLVENIDDICIMPYDNNEAYEHAHPKREKILLKGTNSIDNIAVFIGCHNLHIEDVIFDTSKLSTIKIANTNNFTITNCEAKNSDIFMGFEIINSDGIFNNCYASGNKYDGFNFHGYGTTILNDCVSENNQDDGCSHHDGCVGTINGGRYSNNGKAGIAPAYGATVNINNAVADGNVIGIGYLTTDNGHAPMIGTVNSCVLVNNSNVGLYAQPLCTLTAINCKYSGNTLDKSGIRYEY